MSKIEKVPRMLQVKSREKIRQIRENWSQLHKQVLKKLGTEPGVQKGKRFLLACPTRCKCSIEAIRNSVKVKLQVGI